MTSERLPLVAVQVCITSLKSTFTSGAQNQFTDCNSLSHLFREIGGSKVALAGPNVKFNKQNVKPTRQPPVTKSQVAATQQLNIQHATPGKQPGHGSSRKASQPPLRELILHSKCIRTRSKHKQFTHHLTHQNGHTYTL